jgi:hypothetical protein
MILVHKNPSTKIKFDIFNSGAGGGGRDSLHFALKNSGCKLKFLSNCLYLNSGIKLKSIF